MSFAMRARIMALHGGSVLKRSALSIRGGAHVFEQLLSGKGYATALEIGTYRGVAAAEMSQYVERVVTIDLKQGKLENSGENFDRLSFWASLDLKGRVDLFLANDNEDKRNFVETLSFDFAFIDGAHDQTVKDDFEMVKHCGRVLFHDYDRRGTPEKDYVYDFVNTLPKEQVQVIDIFAYWTAPNAQ